MLINNQNIILKNKITEGKLYCIYNEMYNYYGNNVYKLGKIEKY